MVKHIEFEDIERAARVIYEFVAWNVTHPSLSIFDLLRKAHPVPAFPEWKDADASTRGVFYYMARRALGVVDELEEVGSSVIHFDTDSEKNVVFPPVAN